MKAGTRALLRAHIISSYAAEIVTILAIINRRFGIAGVGGARLLVYFIMIAAAPLQVPVLLVIMPVYEIVVRHNVPNTTYYAEIAIYAIVFVVAWRRPEPSNETLDISQK